MWRSMPKQTTPTLTLRVLASETKFRIGEFHLQLHPTTLVRVAIWCEKGGSSGRIDETGVLGRLYQWPL